MPNTGDGPTDRPEQCRSCGGPLVRRRDGARYCPGCALNAAVAAAREPWSVLPESLGDFELVREIGRGGMGIVFEARQVSLQRRVAVKVLHPGLGLSASASERFEREARAAAALHHSNIVPVFACGETQGLHYYAMELVDGRTIADWIASERRARSVESTSVTATLTRENQKQRELQIAAWIADAAEGLNYAHERGTIHRDIKPANLMLGSDGRIRITDFGLARAAEDPGLTVSGVLMGTPQYMSPEQVAAEQSQIDHRTDIYSLGVVLYELLALECPIQGSSREQVLSQILQRDPKALRSVDGQIARDLETICHKAISRERNARYASAAAMAADLRRFVQGEPIQARRMPWWRRLQRQARRRPGLTAACAASVVVITALSWSALQASARREAQLAQAIATARLAASDGDSRAGLEALAPWLEDPAAGNEVRLLQARLLMESGHADQALASANRVLARNPNDWVAHLIVAAIYADSGLAGVRTWSHDTIDHLREVERLAPASPETLFLRSLLERDPSRALALLERVLEVLPDHSGALGESVRRHGQLSQFDAGRQRARQLVSAQPRSAVGWRLLCDLEAIAGDFPASLTAAEQAVRVEPRDPRSWIVKAWSHHDVNQLAACRESADMALALDPRNAGAFRARAHCRWSAGDLTGAKEDLERAIDVKPDFIFAYAGLLIMAHETPIEINLEQLIERIDRSLQGIENPDAKCARDVFMAWRELRAGNTSAAVETLRRGLSYNLSDDAAHWAYGELFALARSADLDPEPICSELLNRPFHSDLYVDLQLSLLGRRCPAEKVLTRVEDLLGERPQRFTIIELRSQLRASLGDLEGAVSDLDRVLELAPGQLTALEARAKLQLRRGAFARALEDADRMLERAPGNRSGRAMRVDALLDLDRADEALLELDRALADSPRDPGMIAAKVRTLLAQGDASQAAELASSALLALPDSFQLNVLDSAIEAALGQCSMAVQRLDAAVRVADGAAIARDREQLTLAVQRAELVAAGCNTDYQPDRWLESISAAQRRLERSGRLDERMQAMVALARGATLYRAGRFVEARRDLRRATKDDTVQEPTALLFAAMCAYRVGDRLTADSHYQAAHKVPRWRRSPLFDKLDFEARELRN